MEFDHPSEEQTAQLLTLWKQVFGEYNGFWELFQKTAFHPRRCRCVTLEGKLAASLCWLDCSCAGQKIAYLYAVVTHPDFRGRGLCRELLADVHNHLKNTGYASAMLVPAEEGLREMYRKLGYRNCTRVSEISVAAGEEAADLRAIGPAEYARLRREFLPENGVVQEKENLPFLAQQAQFYTGADFLLAAFAEDSILQGMELLGNADAAPGIVRALNCQQGSFRMPGEEQNFAMIFPLTETAVIPAYFGFAFD